MQTLLTLDMELLTSCRTWARPEKLERVNDYRVAMAPDVANILRDPAQSPGSPFLRAGKRGHAAVALALASFVYQSQHVLVMHTNSMLSQEGTCAGA